jgi:hypothetical protein
MKMSTSANLRINNYSLPSERIDVAALRAATSILGFICLFLRWEGSIKNLRSPVDDNSDRDFYLIARLATVV